jgi:2,4-dienoyl-CoA reductase (NADPH2)
LPDEALYLHRPGMLRAGDCVAPRTLLEAVLEARRAAMAISAADQLPELSALTLMGGSR